jgi:acetolactate synthase-1/2/3 large subunit
MNGAQSLVQTLVNCGVDVCFANPGTSEMHFVSALDSVPAMRPVLCLFEGVATGAADGYGRISGKPAATLLHLGPGLANGLANLHNARRAASPVVNVVGDHATTHHQYDAPLTADIEGFARPVSSWIASSKSAADVAGDAARAVQAARSAPGGVATLILPADTAWSPAEGAVGPLPEIVAGKVGSEAIERVAQLLGNGKKTALLMRGKALRGAGLEAAGRIQAKTGARLLCDTLSPLTELGAGRVSVERIPYFAEQIVAFLRDIEQIVLVGAKPPVSFFAYPGKPSFCAPEGCQFARLAQPHEDGVRALQDLALALDALAEPRTRNALALGELPPDGPLDAFKVAQIVAHLTPDDVIYSEEAATSSLPLLMSLARARPHLHMPVCGGSIGQALPVAVGAALAAPDRKIVCASGDGGAAYTLQALWTMARENLDVTTIIYANRSYLILNIELVRVGASAGPRALSMLDLHNPEMNWTRIAAGFGVEASRATTTREFADQYKSAMATRGPRLIEAMI